MLSLLISFTVLSVTVGCQATRQPEHQQEALSCRDLTGKLKVEPDRQKVDAFQFLNEQIWKSYHSV